MISLVRALMVLVCSSMFPSGPADKESGWSKDCRAILPSVLAGVGRVAGNSRCAEVSDSEMEGGVAINMSSVLARYGDCVASTGGSGRAREVSSSSLKDVEADSSTSASLEAFEIKGLGSWMLA